MYNITLLNSTEGNITDIFVVILKTHQFNSQEQKETHFNLSQQCITSFYWVLMMFQDWTHSDIYKCKQQQEQSTVSYMENNMKWRKHPSYP